MECVDVTEQGQISKHFNILAQQRINLAASVGELICSTATELNGRVIQDLQELTKPSCRRSRGSRSRRSSNSRSSSKTQALRLEAEKARLALAFAEEENQWKVEAEIKILKLERKQRELLRRREVEEEQLKDTISLESLKTEADSKLAEARKVAAIMELGVKIAEDMMEVIHASHIGIEGCIRRACESLYWPRISTELRAYISTCDVCLTNRDY